MKERNKKLMKFLPAALIVMSLTLAGVTCAKAVLFKMKEAAIPADIKAAVDAGVRTEEEIKAYQKRYTDCVSDLKKKGIFATPPAKKVNPIKKVDAIMGDEVLIKNKWYKVGDVIGDAKLVLIGSAQITVEWNGKETKFSPISAPTTYAVKLEEKPVEEVAAVKEERVEVVEEVKGEVMAVTESAAEHDPLDWVGVQMSPELKAKFLEKWNLMTDEQRAEGKKRWEAMSDSQKEMMVTQMEMYKDRI